MLDVIRTASSYMCFIVLYCVFLKFVVTLLFLCAPRTFATDTPPVGLRTFNRFMCSLSFVRNDDATLGELLRNKDFLAFVYSSCIYCIVVLLLHRFVTGSFASMCISLASVFISLDILTANTNNTRFYKSVNK